MTWRHTVAVLITFSRNQGLTSVVREAQRATQEHPSRRGEIVAKTDTYFVSNHVHPDDPDKTVEVHHLLFNLYTESTAGSDLPDALGLVSLATRR